MREAAPAVSGDSISFKFCLINFNKDLMVATKVTTATKRA